MNALRPDMAPGEPAPRSLLDDLMADDLSEGDIVYLDEQAHKFVLKVPHGPHVFWNGAENREVRYGTAALLQFMEDNRYYRPGRGAPTFTDAGGNRAEHAIRLKAALGRVPEGPRSRAEIRYVYVAKYIKMRDDPQRSGPFPRNAETAAAVIEAVEEDAAKFGTLMAPKRPDPRSVLRWIATEHNLGLQEAGLVHGNSVNVRPRRIPQRVYELIAQEIRAGVNVSHLIGPSKIKANVKGAIDTENAERGTSYPYPSLSTVRAEHLRYDAWIRKAKKDGIAAADLEYGAVGKLERPKRILDLVELDHHLFDLHPVTGDLGKTHLGIELAKGGLDRFWICLALDVHSGYPVGFAITFEPGGLVPALMCVDHAIRPKTYVRERWPEIDGEILSFGKPVKIRYDNAREFVSDQLHKNLARIGVGFEFGIPGLPASKPYVERHFGTLERDFVHWLKGATGSNPAGKGDRKPQKEAAVNLDDFLMLFHLWLIEVYARRPQEGLDWETPEQRWLRGASSPAHRPRPLTQQEKSTWDLVQTLEVSDRKATREGIRWENIFYQSHDLQKLRRMSSTYGQRKDEPLPIVMRIPLLDLGRAYVTIPKGTPGFPEDQAELVVHASNPHVRGRTIWQHYVVCDWLKARKLSATNDADYERGFRNLFRSALEKMGAAADGRPGKVTLSGGVAPRFAGVYLGGADQPAMAKVTETVERYDLLAEFAGEDRNDRPDHDDPLAPEPEPEAAPNDLDEIVRDQDLDWGSAQYDENDR